MATKTAATSLTLQRWRPTMAPIRENVRTSRAPLLRRVDGLIDVICGHAADELGDDLPAR
jgi:hypothetical protein